MKDLLSIHKILHSLSANIQSLVKFAALNSQNGYVLSTFLEDSWMQDNYEENKAAQEKLQYGIGMVVSRYDVMIETMDQLKIKALSLFIYLVKIFSVLKFCKP